jgi:DNA-directed RNA polymerase specialized sigma subunit
MLDSIRRGAYVEATRLPLDEAPDVYEENLFEESIDSTRRSAAVESAVGRLAARHRLVIRRHYHAGEGLAAVAVKLKCGPSRASQIHLEAVRALRSRLV